MKPVRVVIHVRDVMNITGLKEGGARLLLHKIKKSLCKKPSQCVTIKEFCEYLGIEEEIISDFFKD